MLNAIMEMNLTFNDFQAHLHETFWVELDNSEKYALTLSSVRDLGEKHGETLPRAFSLLFHNARKDAYLPQRTYHMLNETMGALDIFLVPLGPDEIGMSYEAIFA